MKTNSSADVKRPPTESNAPRGQITSMSVACIVGLLCSSTARHNLARAVSLMQSTLRANRHAFPVQN